MKTKNGRFKELFDKQIKFQQQVTNDHFIPQDSIKWASYHMLALSEEVGELLKSDKRWKTHRNSHFNPENKLEELADCLITLMNVAMFSTFDSNDLLKAVNKKQNSNFEKLENSKKRGAI